MAGLKPEKLIKILYLINSRQSYSNNFFQNSLIHLESGDLIRSLKTSQIHTLFTIFSSAYKFHFPSLIESLNYEIQFLTDRPSISPFSSKEISTSNLISDSLCEKSVLNVRDQGDKLCETNDFNEALNKYKKLESICLCVMILTLEYITRLKDPNSHSLSNLKNLTFTTQQIFGEEHEWNDLLLILGKKTRNLEASLTHSEITKEMTNEFHSKLENLIEYNQFLVKIFKIEPKYENYMQRVQFFVDFFSCVKPHTSESLNLNKNLLQTDSCLLN